MGRVRRIASQFSFKASEDFLQSNIRVQSDLEPLGCLGDLGWYNIRFSLWVMNEQLPERVTGRILAEQGKGASAVPIEFSGELFFPGSVSASFFCSFRAENQQWANISGTNGYAHIKDFVVPFFGCESTFEVNAPASHKDGCKFNMEDHTRRLAVREYSNNATTAQETRMFETFSNIVLTGKLEPRWGEQALNTQRVLDACLRSAHEKNITVTVD